MATLGVDISEHNGSVDFKALKNAGVKFVIIRCGFGSNYTSQDDKRFEENVLKADSVGMPWGVYLYSYATNTGMAQSEAQHVLRLLDGRKPLYGVWYDVEDPQLKNADVVNTTITFCEAMEAAGLYAGVYSMISWLNGKLNSSRLDAYDKWVAQWNSVCQYGKAYGIWQYTDNLVIGGKSFDGNYSYKDYPAIVKGMGGETEDPEEVEVKELTEAEVKKIVQSEIKAYFAGIEKGAVSEWAKEAVEFVKAHGIMNGDPDGNFRPQDFVTRQELAQTFYNQRENK